jgi:hypothetical protein
MPPNADFFKKERRGFSGSEVTAGMSSIGSGSFKPSFCKNFCEGVIA